jgi:hypothetical protein
MQASKKHDVVYVLTKQGYAYVYDVPSGGVIFRHKLSDMPIFASVPHEASGGVLAVAARSGAVSLLTLNPATLVGYVTGTLRNQPLAMALAGRLGLTLALAALNPLLALAATIETGPGEDAHCAQVLHKAAAAHGSAQARQPLTQ